MKKKTKYKPLLKETSCIVCGAIIWWDRDPNPACYHHSYGEVCAAIVQRKKHTKKS